MGEGVARGGEEAKESEGEMGDEDDEGDAAPAAVGTDAAGDGEDDEAVGCEEDVGGEPEVLEITLGAGLDWLDVGDEEEPKEVAGELVTGDRAEAGVGEATVEIAEGVGLPEEAVEKVGVMLGEVRLVLRGAGVMPKGVRVLLGEAELLLRGVGVMLREARATPDAVLGVLGEAEAVMTPEEGVATAAAVPVALLPGLRGDKVGAGLEDAEGGEMVEGAAVACSAPEALGKVGEDRVD